MTGDRDTTGSPADIDLEGFLRTLPFLESSDLMAISATYQDADVDGRDAARRTAFLVAKKRRLTDELGRLQGSIVQWAGAEMVQSSVLIVSGVRTDQVLSDLRVQAVPPLLDAATALLLGDALDTESRATLLEPWSSGIG